MMKFCRHYDSLWTLFHLSPTSMCCMVATNLPVFSPSCMPTGTTRTLGHFYTSHSQFVGGEGWKGGCEGVSDMEEWSGVSVLV